MVQLVTEPGIVIPPVVEPEPKNFLIESSGLAEPRSPRRNIRLAYARIFFRMSHILYLSCLRVTIFRHAMLEVYPTTLGKLLSNQNAMRGQGYHPAFALRPD